MTVYNFCHSVGSSKREDGSYKQALWFLRVSGFLKVLDEIRVIFCIYLKYLLMTSVYLLAPTNLITYWRPLKMTLVSLISNSSLLKTHCAIVLTAELGIFLFREIKVNNL